MKKIILTGDRPTGRLHIGHYVGSLKRRVELQNSGEYEKTFIMIADAQALTDNIDNPEKVRQNIIEVALDYLSCGIDPSKSTILIQSQISELCELTFYYMDLVTVSRLQRNPTVKAEIQMRNFETSLPVGFFTYPISQAADITAFKATTVPVGEDQLPMIEQTREIVRKFNASYAEVLVEPDALLPTTEAAKRLPGTDGKAKMSKSLGNCIYLSDTPEEVRQKVMSMYTDPTHIALSDPGHLEGNAVFTYLDAFSKPEHFEKYLPDYANLDELKAHYTRGGLGDVKVKKFLNNIMQETLEPIRARRKEFEQDIPEVYNILKKGSDAAREVAAKTLSEVKAAMKIDYFSDAELIKAQSEKYKK
ncbi:MAG: tryptophan--tRNA ligase [Clostridia bacterium]|nr:tryptophan--tRNA ligase [Clostridia bacterium]